MYIYIYTFLYICVYIYIYVYGVESTWGITGHPIKDCMESGVI